MPKITEEFLSMKEEQEHKVAKYLKKYIKHGYKEEEIKNALHNAGYTNQVIEKVFKNINNQPKKKFLFQDHDHLHISPRWYSLAAIIIILAIALPIIIMTSTKDCNFDKQCFIENALKNKQVKVKEDVAGSTLQYSYKDNILTKEFVKFSKDEPEEVIILLKDKKIRCETDFKEELVDGVFGGVEYCEGELLNVIYELKIIS